MQRPRSEACLPTTRPADPDTQGGPSLEEVTGGLRAAIKARRAQRIAASSADAEVQRKAALLVAAAKDGIPEGVPS
eukprot:692871-Karenia_brevis.AAC.1